MRGVTKENIQLLSQLVGSLEEADLELEKSYQEKDYENFNKSKRLILQVQKKISEEIK